MDLKRKLAATAMTLGSAASPLPQIEVNSTKAPGLKAPKGISPQQNYSRLNSGMPPQPDAGAMEQKSAPPMGATMLPTKVASEGSMGTMSTTPTLQNMVKSALDGANSRVRIAEEAAIQQANMGDKTASEKCSECKKEPCTCKDKKASAGLTSEYVEKLARALEFAAPFVKSAADLAGPYNLTDHTQAVGKGPGALHVMQAEASKPLPDHKGQGRTQIPVSTPLQTAVAGSKTQLENNHAKHTHGEMIQKNVGKTASVIAKLAKDEKAEKEETEGMSQASKGLEKAEKAHSEENEKKEASLLDIFLGVKKASIKTAEDAINPAHISAGAAVPPDTSAAGESGGTPAGGAPQGPTGLVGSNESAINYNKNQAKAPSKTDSSKYWNEPALSGANDTVLRDAFVHSSASDNNKMASANGVTKTAAARALLSKLAETAQDKVAKG